MVQYLLMTLPRVLSEIVAYPPSVIAELKKITWPPAKQVLNLTLIVLVVIAFSTLLVAGMDFIFTELMGILI